MLGIQNETSNFDASTITVQSQFKKDLLKKDVAKLRH